MHKMCTLFLILLTSQQASGFSTPKAPLTTHSLVSNVQVAWRSHRTPSLLFMAEESSEEKAEEPEEDETEATTTGLFIPGFSDQVEQVPEPPPKKKPEPPKKKEEPKKEKFKAVVNKEEAISKAESAVSEAVKKPSEGGRFSISNPFANKSAEKPLAPKPPTPPKVEAKKEEPKPQKQVESKKEAPSIPLPKISLFQSKPKQPTPPPPPTNNDPISASIGGALTGAALGLYTDVATDFLFDTDLPPIVPPAALGVAIGAAAFAAADQPNFLGKTASFVFGGPIRSVKNFFVKKIEDTVDNIVSTPGKYFNDVDYFSSQMCSNFTSTLLLKLPSPY